MTLTQAQRKNMIGIAVAGLFVLAAVAYYWFMFGKSTVRKNNDNLEKYKTELKTVQAELDKIVALEKMRDQFDQIEAELDAIEERLPSSKEAPGFLKALSDILRNSGVGTLKLVSDPLNESAEFTEIPYSITASGRYHEFGQFLNLVEENPQRFMRVKTMKLANDPERLSLHPINVGIATFMFVER